jgi:hypothetical protein
LIFTAGLLKPPSPFGLSAHRTRRPASHLPLSFYHRHVGPASQPLISPTFSPPSEPRDCAVGQGCDAIRAGPHGRRPTPRAPQMRATPPEIALHCLSLYPETLAPPYKSSPQPQLPVPRRPWISPSKCNFLPPEKGVGGGRRKKAQEWGGRPCSYPGRRGALAVGAMAPILESPLYCREEEGWGGGAEEKREASTKSNRNPRCWRRCRPLSS